jgi:hypothetical protein
MSSVKAYAFFAGAINIQAKPPRTFLEIGSGNFLC